jgi:hypothetical protein
MVRVKVATVDNGVAHGFVGIIYAHFRAKTPPDAFLGTIGHFFEARQDLLDCRVPTPRRGPLATFLPHLQFREPTNYIQ